MVFSISLAAGLLFGEPLAVIYADANVLGTFEGLRYGDARGAVFATLVLVATLAGVYRWSWENAGVWLPVVRGSLRRACRSTALVGWTAMAVFYAIWWVMKDSPMIGAFYLWTPELALIAYRGTRRGETCGVRWIDLNKAASSLKIAEQLVQLGWKVEAGKPKSDAGDRIIGLDDATNATLEAWRKKQIAERLAYGSGWIRSGRIFTRPDGAELHPADVTKYFNQLVAVLGLPPIRLHVLRHGAATLALEADVDIKVVQELLGHSSSVLTRDTYTSVSPRLAKEAAERTAAMVPRRSAKAV